MKNLKVLIIILLILIILIIAILGVLLFQININEKKEESELEAAFNIENQLTQITSNNDYFNVKSCMDKYKSYSLDLYYVTKDGEEGNPFAEDYKQELLNLMPQFVKDKLNLNSSNAYDKVGLPDKLLRIDKIYKSMQTINKQEYENETEIYTYVVESTLIDRDTYAKEDILTIVLMDLNTGSFYIVPQLYIEQENLKINEGDNLLLYQEKTIEKNEYNGYKYTIKNESDMILEYLSRMKFNLKYDIEYVYDQLNEDYKNARFGNLEEFKKYVEENKQRLDAITVSKYKRDITDDYTQYTILDQNDNYYIFRETAVMQYSVILDTYSIDLPEFIEKYNKATEQEKVAMNIDKFIQAINAQDYKYAYSKLSEGFKNNYFKTQASFEKYVKDNFYTTNEITFNSFNNQANIYTYTTIIKDKTTGQTKQQNFVVKLNEGTEFEMSFEV